MPPRIMRAMFIASLGLFCAATTPALTEDKTLKTIETGDPEMAAAAARAREGLDDFLAKLDNPPAGTANYSIKIGIFDKDGGYGFTRSMSGAEYFWLGNIRRTPEGFTASISNAPAIIRNVAIGQDVTFTKDDIFDWMYFKDEKIVGNVTSCPLLRRSSAEELAYWRDNYGLDCGS